MRNGVSYKASVVDLRKQDLQKISSATKAWVNQQLLKRPKEILLYRSKEEGGLGLVNVVARAGAKLTKTFLDQCLLGSPYFNNYLIVYLFIPYSIFYIPDSLPI